MDPVNRATPSRMHVKLHCISLRFPFWNQGSGSTMPRFCIEGIMAEEDKQWRGSFLDEALNSAIAK